MFIDRIDAGQQLATALEKHRDQENTVVIALPRGGVVPGYIISKRLHLPLEVALVKKIGHPFNREFAIGAVSLKGRILNGHKGVSQESIEKSTKEIRKLLQKRYKIYHGNKPPIDVSGKTVIVVDDGVATGKTLIAALELMHKEKPKDIIVAIPVGPTQSIEQLKKYANKVICLESYDHFYALGAYYENFAQVSDEDVISLLEKANQELQLEGSSEQKSLLPMTQVIPFDG